MEPDKNHKTLATRLVCPFCVYFGHEKHGTLDAMIPKIRVWVERYMDEYREVQQNMK
jgi:hypothetical protein